jgi:2-polyprenyl-3-methyl-5-hydroxy-6-metoxy-1,4-benzoquinol methylase
LYEPFAEAFESHAACGAYNAHYDRPAVLDLIGEVDGLRVLDAGCGPGFYASELVARGAEVTAFDSSPTMVSLAQARLGTGSDVRVWDLESPLT